MKANIMFADLIQKSSYVEFCKMSMHPAYKAIYGSNTYCFNIFNIYIFLLNIYVVS